MHIYDIVFLFDSNTDGNKEAAEKFDSNRGRGSGIPVKMFFGGLPDTIVPPSRASISDKAFIGCVSDTTINGELVNFAISSASYGEQLEKCPIQEPARDDAVVPTGSTDIPTLFCFFFSL